MLVNLIEPVVKVSLCLHLYHYNLLRSFLFINLLLQSFLNNIIQTTHGSFLYEMKTRLNDNFTLILGNTNFTNFNMLQEGFYFHHAEPKHMMLVNWIPETTNTLPAGRWCFILIGYVSFDWVLQVK